jgi:hypothetical protein
VSRLEDLPPDLHAVLSLVLCRQKGYLQVAGMVGIEERAVHDRAHAALAMLAPRQARELSAAQRELVGEYVLGQDDPASRGETRAHLESDAPARAWAQALVAELAPLASRPLPEIPAGSASAPLPEIPTTSAAAPTIARAQPGATPPAGEPETAPPTPSSTQPLVEPPPASPAAEREPQAGTEAARSSRRGGMIVLGVTAAVVIAAVVLIVGVGGSGSSRPSSTAAASSTPATTSTPAASSTPATSSTSTSSTTGSTKSKTAAGEPRIDATIPLTSPNPADKALGIVEVISRGSVRAFLVVAEHLPPTSGFRYAAWLYNSPTDALLLGSGPKVGSNGILKAAGGLPTNASRYGTIVLTEEHSEKPTQPGPIVLSGTFKVG